MKLSQFISLSRRVSIRKQCFCASVTWTALIMWCFTATPSNRSVRRKARMSRNRVANHSRLKSTSAQGHPCPPFFCIQNILDPKKITSFSPKIKEPPWSLGSDLDSELAFHPIRGCGHPQLSHAAPWKHRVGWNQSILHYIVKFTLNYKFTVTYIYIIHEYKIIWCPCNYVCYFIMILGLP